MARRSSHHHPHAPDPAALAQEAQGVFERAGEQWTAMRAAVFQAVAEAVQPISAYDIAELVSARLGRRVAANTIYRILDLFAGHNLVNRIESRNAYIACAHPAQPQDCIFLVCEQCSQATHVDDPAITQLVRDAAQRVDFLARRPVIEVKGLCRNCRVMPA